MDYKYIEQLLERYWVAETTEKEESILRAFFSQPDVPAHLLPYKELFSYEQSQAEISLSDDFDEKILQKIGATEPQTIVVRAKRESIFRSLRPLYEAAAAIAIVAMVGYSASSYLNKQNSQSPWDYNPASYQDSYQSAQQSYKVVQDGLEMFQKTASADSTKQNDNPNMMSAMLQSDAINKDKDTESLLRQIRSVRIISNDKISETQTLHEKAEALIKTNKGRYQLYDTFDGKNLYTRKRGETFVEVVLITKQEGHLYIIDLTGSMTEAFIKEITNS